jgi:hypothetical protein
MSWMPTIDPDYFKGFENEYDSCLGQQEEDNNATAAAS